MKIYTWAGMPESDNGAVIANSAYHRAGYLTIGGSYNVSIDNQTFVPALNTFYARPFSVSQIGQSGGTTRNASEFVGYYLASMFISITVAAAAGGVVRFGVYTNTSSTNMYPDSLVFDSGSLNTTTITNLSSTVNLTLNTTRMYWYTLLFGTAAPTIRANGRQWMLSGGADSTFTPVSNSLTAAQTFGALPATFPSGGTPEATTNYGRVYITISRII